jgi:hypothetical protein
MSKFSTIYEKWIDSGKLRSSVAWAEGTAEFFINPSPSDLSECGDDCRGIIDGKGNLYTVASRDENIEYIHADMHEFLSKSKEAPLIKGDFYNYWVAEDRSLGGNMIGLTVMRVGSTKEFKVGESVTWFKDKRGDAEIKKGEVIKKFLDKASKKNKGLKFTLEKI